MTQLTRTRPTATPTTISTGAAAAPAVEVAEEAGGRFATLAVLGQRDFRYLFLSSIATGYAQWGQMIGIAGWKSLRTV